MNSSKKVIAKPTKGDGNCAFNAFDLAFWKEEIISSVEKNLEKDGLTPGDAFADFIVIAAKKGLIALPEDVIALPLEEAIKQIDNINLEEKWEEAKQKIIELRQISEENFQVQMAFIMRELAIFLAEKEDAENDYAHRQRTIQPLTSAFRDFVLKQLVVDASGVRDDIYQQHDFIEKKKFPKLFEEIKTDLSLAVNEQDIKRYDTLKKKKRTKEENAEYDALEKKLDQVLKPKQEELVNWWERKGYKTFLTEMKKDGQWAGDLELSQLGRYFRVNVNAHKKEIVHHVHIEHGSIPRNKLDEKQIKPLEVRGIVNPSKKQDTSLKLLPLTKKDVIRRLGAIFESKKILDFLSVKEKEKTPLPSVMVPRAWSATSKLDMLQRDIIGTTATASTRNTERDYKFNNITDEKVFSEQAYSEVKARIQEVENKDELVKTWEAYHQDAPTLPLVNDNALHWSEGEVVEISARVAKSIVAYTESEAYKATIEKIATWETSKDENEKKWEQMAKAIDEKEEALKLEQVKVINPDAELIKYSTAKEEIEQFATSEDKIKNVTKDTQEELDSQLAKELQQAEYSQLKEQSAQEALDRLLAEKLQQEEYSSKKETLQEEQDRLLAEKLQEEEYTRQYKRYK